MSYMDEWKLVGKNTYEHDGKIYLFGGGGGGSSLREAHDFPDIDLDMTEFDKLADYLESHGYKYIRKDTHPRIDCFHFHQLVVFDGDRRSWDAIISETSYGAKGGLLEVMGDIVMNDEDSVEGWLTADVVIKRLEESNETESDRT